MPTRFSVAKLAIWKRKPLASVPSVANFTSVPPLVWPCLEELDNLPLVAESFKENTTI